MKKTEKPRGKMHLLQIVNVSNLPSDLEGVANQLQSASAILRQQPFKLNPCPTVCYVLVLPKEQGKGKWALPKNLRRKDVWKTLFRNKSSGTINPVYLPQTILKTTKNVSVSIKKTLSITTLPQYFYPAT